MGTLMSLYNYYDDEYEMWDKRAIHQKYLIHKQIEGSNKIKLRSVEGNEFYNDLETQFKKKKSKKAKR
jgi:hypothetical protein